MSIAFPIIFHHNQSRNDQIDNKQMPMRTVPVVCLVCRFPVLPTLEGWAITCCPANDNAMATWMFLSPQASRSRTVIDLDFDPCEMLDRR